MGLSRRTTSFSTPISMIVRRRREEVRIVPTVVTLLCELSRRRHRHDPSLTLFASPCLATFSSIHQSGKTSLLIPKCGLPSPTRMTWRCPSKPFARGRLGFSGPYSYPVSINFCTFDTPASLLVRFVSFFPSRSFEGGCVEYP
jgi:hypothetical protein